MAVKKKTIKYSIFKIKHGGLMFHRGSDEAWMGATCTRKGVCLLVLPKNTEEEVLNDIKSRAGEKILEESAKDFEKLKKDIADYFNGKEVDFEQNIDLTEFTPFQSAVFAITRNIPYGETKSYRWVAKKVGNPKGCRAVGQALKTNSIPILIPCHRVIEESGKIGGFSPGKGWKEKLLALEGTLLT